MYRKVMLLKILLVSMLFAVFAFCLTPPMCYAAVYYVSPTGDNNNPGTESQPWLTAQKAFNTVQPGDTVHFAPGVYPETDAHSITSGTESAPITLIGDGNFEAIIDEEWEIKHSWYIIRGFFFRDSLGAHDNLALVGANANHNVIDHNKFTPHHVGIVFKYDSGTGTIDHGRGDTSYNIISNNDFSNNAVEGASIAVHGTGNIIEKNTFHDNNGHDAMHIWGDGTIIRENLFDHLYAGPEADPPNDDHSDIIQTFATSQEYAATNIIFEKNIIIGCSNQLGNLTTDDGFDLITGWTFRNNLFINSRLQLNIYITHVSVYNNTCIGNTYANGFRFAYDPDWGHGSGDYGRVFNNLFIQCDGYYSFNSGNTHCESDYNIYTSPTNGPDDHFNEVHGINGGYTPEQIFSDPANDDYHLTENSPAKDAGTDLSPDVTEDIEDTTRPQGNGWDMGAYEYTESGGGSGGGSGDGEPHSPKTFTVGAAGCDYTSIQAVFDNNDLGPNDVIEVHEGTYHEQVVWGSDDDGDATGFVTLRAKPGDHVVITGDRSRNYCVRLVDRHYCKIEGFETIQALNGISIYKGDHFLVWNCVSHDHDTSLGQFAVGIRAVGASYVDIRNCKVYDTAWNGIKIASEVDNGDSINFLIERCDVSAEHTSIDLKSTPNSALADVTIRYNKIHGRAGIYSENRTGENVSDIKIYYNLFTECGGAHIATQTNPNDTSTPFTDWKIYNNTFDKCGTVVSNSHMEFLSGLTNSEIKNNIFSRANYANIDGQTRSLRFSNDVTGLELDHNCYHSLYSDSQTLINWNGTAYNTLADFQTATGQETHGFAQNPRFAPNYSLLSNSPCIDAGVKLSIHDTSWRDFAGNRVRYGTAPDIGCYEAKTWRTSAWGMLPWIGGSYKIQWAPYAQ